MKLTSPSPFAPLMRRMLSVLAAAALTSSSAQSAPPTPSASALDFRMDLSAPVPEHQMLPRIFYSPPERRNLEIAEASALSEAEPGGKSAPAAAVRFNGWLSGPGPTRAWINGTAHVASGPDGAITPQAKPALGPADRKDEQQTIESTARFDASTQQLVIVSARGMERRLRAGQSEDQDRLLPLAASSPPPTTVLQSETAPPDAPAAEERP